MYKQQAAKHAPIRELLEEVPEEDVAAAEADDDDAAQPIWQEEADNNALFYQVEAVLLDSELFARFCLVQGHSDMQQGERRSMDQREFITMLQSLGVMEDSPAAPTHEALLKTAHRISKTMAACIFRDASGVAKQRKEVSERVRRTGLRGSQTRVAELNFSSFCAAATAVARYLTQGPDKSMHVPPQASIVASTSGLKMERVLQDRPSKKALAAKLLNASPLKWGMPREMEGYREERRRLLFANLPAGFHCPDAPPPVAGAEEEEEKVLPEDPVLDRVEHFLLDLNLFLKYCMVEGHSALQSGSRQKSMDLHEFQYMLNEVGALKSGELGRAHGAVKSKPAKNLPAGGDGRIPAIDGLERKLLTRRQCTNCFRAAIAQSKTQALIAAGELNYELYKIAAKIVAKIYVYGEPEAVEEERGGKGGGRTSCPPGIPQMAPAHSNTEIYAKILEALPRRRPNGVDELLDEVENVLLDPEVFERFCVTEGHSSLQMGSRRSTMDQHEWFRCLADLGLMPADILKENKVVDPFLQKRAKKEPAPKYPAVVAKLERRLTKEQAGFIFRRALGTTGSSHGAAAGELNFRRYCVAALRAAKWLVHGVTKIDPEDDKPDAQSTKSRTKAKLFEMRSKGIKSNLVQKSEWNARFHQPDPPAPARSHDHEARSSKVSFNLSTDIPRPSVERVLSEKCLALAQEGDRGMLREEFCARFATRDTYSKHLTDRKGASESQEAVDLDANKALRQALVDTLSEVKLIPDFISKEAVTEIVASDLPEASVRPSTQKSVSFGGVPPQGHAVEDIDPSVSNTGDTPDQPAVHVSTTGRYCPFSAFRHCFDHFAGKVDLNVIKEFLQSPHAWIQNPSASYPGARIPFGLRQRRYKRQAPQTPWTQAHPTAAYRPRTSVRKLMLNQKELRRKHVKHQQMRREKEMRRLEELRAEVEIKQKQEQERTDKRAHWIRTLEAVDAKIHELHRQELLELEQEALLHWNESHEVSPLVVSFTISCNSTHSTQHRPRVCVCLLSLVHACSCTYARARGTVM
jgi:hypothetical protein